MTSLLLTNDDGIDSPALLPTYRALAAIVDHVTVVVPHIERSWIGKAISRHDEILMRTEVRDGVEITTTTGYPADCTQAGLFNTGHPLPDMVVSGINIGANHSTAFLFGSGTVGAAIESALVGVPAIALSASSAADNFGPWNSFMRSADSTSTWETIAAVSAGLVATVLSAGFPSDVDVLTVNLPEGVSASSPLAVAPLGHTGYGQLFKEHKPGVLKHDWVSDVGPVAGADISTSDIELCHRGSIVVTPLQLPKLSNALTSTEALFRT